MAFQFSTTLRTNMASQLQATGGTAAVLKIWTGSEPASAATADSGTSLVSITLPSTFLTSASGAASLSGTWSGTASASGTAGYFRIYDSSGNCHIQGNVTTDLVLNNTSINSGQTVSITGFTVTIGNA